MLLESDSDQLYPRSDDEYDGLCRQLSFDELPCELWGRVFSYLDPIEDQLPRLSLVCRKWRAMLRHFGHLWRNIVITPANCPVTRCYGLINSIFWRYGEHVETLTWVNGSRVYESSLHCISKLVNLKSLRLPILWNRSVLDCLAPVKLLETVHINGGFDLKDSDLIQIAENFGELKRITLNGCWSLTSAGIKEFLRKLKRPSAELKLKINAGLPIQDYRSDRAMLHGGLVVKTIAESESAASVTVLTLNFVSIELEELWSVVNTLPRLRKLAISNCERLHGVRLKSNSLQKVYLLHLWSVLFVSIHAPNLRTLKVDEGLESAEHLEVVSCRLRDVYVDGSGVLHTLNIKNGRLRNMEIFNCQDLDTRSLVQSLAENPTLTTLRIGDVGVHDLSLDDNYCPSLQDLCLLDDFSCRSLRVRCHNLRVLHTDEESDLDTLNDVLVMADRLKKVSLVGVPNLRNFIVQCESIDKIELNICSDYQVCLETCIIQAFRHLGFLRFFDCSVQTLILSTPSAGVVVLYRCNIGDYVLEMALNGCPNIAHLNLEKCSALTKVRIPMTANLMRYLNLFGCKDMLRVDLHCRDLLALNLGECPNVRLFLNGVERNLALSSLNTLEFPRIVLPSKSVRWSHDPVPELCFCS
ncbi:uncharacterized protein [Ptychodera flava]|uniref:uncharacterized protein n=1 Tax=Ptychodera flava TaxID=63121 RepID=UPI00396A6C20